MIHSIILLVDLIRDRIANYLIITIIRNKTEDNDE
jgi:hypothetical protein